MLVRGDAGERRARLALRAGEESHDLVPRQIAEGFGRAEVRDAVEEPALLRDFDDSVHGAADHDDLAPAFPRRVGDGAHARDVRREGRDRDPVRRIPDELGEFARHVAFARAHSIPDDVGRIADEGQNTLVAETAELRLRGQAAEIGRRVELPVAGMHDESVRRADRERVRFGDRVRHRDVFDVEGPDLDPPPRRDLLEVDLGGAGLGKAPRLEEAHREAGGVDGRAQARPHLDERADMILVRMGDEDPEKIVALLLDEAQVGVDEVDAREVLLAAEAHPAIDEDPLPALGRAETVERRVHADLTETAERNEDELVLRCHEGCHLVPAAGPASAGLQSGK